ncbi:Replication protein A DNA-binding subunit [Araneus ventricosus]|uniref:Replication protein A DNA-binding subunit n=1 Tax=Araneus ventricosus TaxID=182803 RepID=A0A4Y2CRA1_ARAVE|nr:Replication protein A DNA-binding subunit [Araneus ventricosus]
MFPQLTNGAINRILNGEEVANAVIQILGCRKIPGTPERYRLLISDGVTGCPFAMLGTQLNHMVSNEELGKFTIVRVDKCVCNQVQTDRKVIILLKITLLFPGSEVNEKFRNPVNSSTSGGATTNAPAVSGIVETGYSKDNVVAAHDLSMIMFPQLTTGAINRILNGEDVANAVIQILGCRKIPGAGNDRYRLLISDGVTDCPFAMLGTLLNHMVANKELEKFTIVRVDKCVCNQVQVDRKVIILLNLTVLFPGTEVNEKFGRPVSSSTSAGTITNALAVNGGVNTCYANQNAVYAHYSSMINGYAPPVLFTQFLYTMFPEVASGAITRILNGEEVANAVIQILGCKSIHGAGNDRYRLLISDGVTGCPFAMLGTQLNHMVANKELEKFTIVRVEKYLCNQVQADKKVIILFNLTVLVPGNEVNKKLGNPVCSSTDAAAATNAPAVNGVAETDYSNNNAVAAHDSSKINGSALSVPFTQLYITLPQLTTGAINRILNEEDVANAVIQILGLKRIPGALNDRYRLLISDGVISYTYVMLGTQLSHMVENKELEKFTILRVGKYVCSEDDRKVIILMNLTVLVPGNEVNKMLGNPVYSSTSGGATSNAPAVNGVAEAGY